MGGNGSYSKTWGGVLTTSRTHVDTGHRIGGHKVLLLAKNNNQTNTPMNSNSPNPVYLCAKVDKKTGALKVTTIAIYKNHKLVKTIDLEFDAKGNVIPYKKGSKKCSHAHKWNDSNGSIGRKKHDSKNTLPVSNKYNSLIKQIDDFNQKMK